MLICEGDDDEHRIIIRIMHNSLTAIATKIKWKTLIREMHENNVQLKWISGRRTKEMLIIMNCIKL